LGVYFVFDILNLYFLTENSENPTRLPFRKFWRRP